MMMAALINEPPMPEEVLVEVEPLVLVEDPNET
jgi:hypothetical protein